MKIGLKIWSINEHYLEEVRRLLRNNTIDYIELFSVPNSFGDSIRHWIELKEETGVNFIIHAPHFMQGLNFAKKDAWSINEKLSKEAFSFADQLGSSYVIFHPGCNGQEEETARQISKLDDSRIVLENKPKKGIDGVIKCNGYSPELIERILIKTGCHFCLDFSHAICAANSLKQDPIQYLNEFNCLGPAMYHICDGDWQSEIDSHQNIGKGNYPFTKLVSLMDLSRPISLETQKDPEHLRDFENDVVRFQDMVKLNERK